MGATPLKAMKTGMSMSRVARRLGKWELELCNTDNVADENHRVRLTALWGNDSYARR